jgi:hypothetical protein
VHEGHAPSETPYWYSLGPRNGREISLRLRLGGTLKVAVHDIAGAALPGAEVELLAGIAIRDGQEPIARAVTSERGEAVLEHLAEGGSVRVRAQGAEQLRTCVWLDDGRVTVVEFVVGTLLTGVVSLEDGTPIRDAMVHIFGPLDATVSATRAEVPIDSLGRYEVRWLAPGGYTARVHGTGVASWFQSVRVGPEPAVAVPLRLGRPSVVGRVKRERPGNEQLYVELASREPGRAFSLAAAADGAFAFHDVLPGEYVLAAREQGSDIEATLPVVVSAGERIERELTLRPRGIGEVELEIVRAGAAYFDRVQLYVGDELGLFSGSIAFTVAGPGRYRFQAASGRRRVTVQWANGGKSTIVDVDVEEGKTVYKTVRLPE